MSSPPHVLKRVYRLWIRWRKSFETERSEVMEWNSSNCKYEPKNKTAWVWFIAPFAVAPPPQELDPSPHKPDWIWPHALECKIRAAAPGGGGRGRGVLLFEARLLITGQLINTEVSVTTHCCQNVRETTTAWFPFSFVFCPNGDTDILVWVFWCTSLATSFGILIKTLLPVPSSFPKESDSLLRLGELHIHAVWLEHTPAIMKWIKGVVCHI